MNCPPAVFNSCGPRTVVAALVLFGVGAAFVAGFASLLGVAL